MSLETITWGIVAAAIWLGIYHVGTIINGAPLF